MTTSARSLWLDTAPVTDYPPLRGPLEVDVAVIGGGITGLSTAVLLHREGARVAVLDAGRVGAGVTGCTTAKVSALQGTVYSTIVQRHGPEAARVYAEASKAGVEQLAATAAAESIDCDLERRPAYTYAASRAERAAVEREAQVAGDAGLPVQVLPSADLPYDTACAVRLDEQLQLHPVRYVQGLAAALAGMVYEQTRVTGIDEGAPCRVRTTGGEVRAEHVVVATHAPIFDRGLYFARLLPSRSYCVAVRLASGSPPHGMAINAGSPTRSVRSYRDLLIVGGEGHTTGSPSASPERFEHLVAFARAHWDVAEVTHRWSAQDPTHYDRLPVIGPYRPGSSRLWVASGFMKWGFATATFAARILTDRIGGRPNPWAATFSPTRLSARSTADVGRLGLAFGAHLAGDRLRDVDADAATDVPPGEARVVGSRRSRTGVYRDVDGGLHAVSVRCTHMGCLLRFNAAEHSWDCPCHGSRFGVDGEVLEGPAVAPLERREPPRA
jgi:glycine/D-amino acid oxidase-like deaminating enzyme/nitrite reductase/ring-hydroxylating ferredoxin subunit